MAIPRMLNVPPIPDTASRLELDALAIQWHLDQRRYRRTNRWNADLVIQDRGAIVQLERRRWAMIYTEFSPHWQGKAGAMP